MKKVFSKKAAIAMVLLILLSILSIFLFMDEGVPSRVTDTEFQSGSGIQFTEATYLQLENLHRLAKVWGFVKYRHPDITSGKLNWDAELFRVMPDVLAADSTEGANKAMLDWLSRFPFEVPVFDAETMQMIKAIDKLIILEADLSWTEDSGVLGDGLSAYLTRLSEVMIEDDTNAYAYCSPETGFVSMNAENGYPNMKYDDTGMRLLGLFRYWNIIEYYFPYRDIMDEDWDSVLTEMLPKFIGEQDEQSYVLAVAELTTRIHDSHAAIGGVNQGLVQYLGAKRPPVEFMNIDGTIVISAVAENAENNPTDLQLGDIVLSMDGISIEDRIDTCKQYISLSNDNRFALRFRYYLLGTNNDTAAIEVLRDGNPLSLTVACREERVSLSGQEPSGFMENERIGYINPSQLSEGTVDKLMDKFRNTDGIVVDLRQYPSVVIASTLAEHLVPTATPFAKCGLPSSIVPGEVCIMPSSLSGSGSYGKVSDKPIYTGKVVLLMDETSISRSEFTVMSLRNAPDAVVLGSPSVGADGDIVSFNLPGEITTVMTGISLFYPDGRQTQRVGLEPDIYCLPTTRDIKAGKDTLVDNAIEIILKTA